MIKQILQCTALTLSLACASSSAATGNYPSRHIEIVVPSTPGTATDVVARIIAEKLSERLGQPVVVSNKAGAASQIGASLVQRAEPDGHTLLVIHSGIIANPLVYKGFTLDLERDFTHVAPISQTPWVIAIHDGLPVNTMADLVAYSKANPGTLNFGITGGSSELDMGMLRNQAGLDAETILYSGGTQVITALATNDIQIALTAVRIVQTMAQRGVRAIAVTSAQRFELAPDLPTLAESGVPGFEGVPLWFGLLGPAGMPEDVTQRLNRELDDILRLPDVAEKLAGMAHVSMRANPAEFSAFIRANIAYYTLAAKVSNVEPQ